MCRTLSKLLSVELEPLALVAAADAAASRKDTGGGHDGIWYTSERAMVSSRRDDFRHSDKEMAAARVGWRCSNPGCQALTVAAKQGPSGIIKTGRACHIRAASPGGPRYDASQTPEARRALENAIWLCSPCSDKIDTDWAYFTVAIIEQWKEEAEDLARLDLARPGSSDQRRSLRFTVIRMNDALSAWRNAWKFRQSPTHFGFHQLAERHRVELGISLTSHTLDPVFDITVLNDGTAPLHVHRLGFLPVWVWSDLKGIPEGYKILKLESYRLAVTQIDEGKPQFLDLPDPVHIPAGAPLRLDVHLAGYPEALQGNESVVRFIVESDAGLHHSRLVYLGVY